MLSPVDSDVYVSDQIFELEQKKLFQELWIFAGLRSMVANDNEFLTREIGGISIVIQNIKGVVRAFENNCAHRNMALQWEPAGKRPLICRYHGWAYDEEGRVRGIPSEGLYGYSREVRGGLCLRQYKLETVGEFLFVNLGENPIPIDAQFYDAFLRSLSDASKHFDREVALTSFKKDYNWKLNFENVLDFHHPQFIHPKTFLPALGNPIGRAQSNGQPTPETGLRAPRDLLAIRRKMELGLPLDLRDLSYKIAGPQISAVPRFASEVNSYEDTTMFHDWFVFPNVNFVSPRGYLFSIQQFCPASANITDYWMWTMTAARRDPSADLTASLWEMTQWEKVIIDEDAIALASMQRTLRPGLHRPIHGDYESNIVRMLSWYRNHLELTGKCSS